MVTHLRTRLHLLHHFGLL